MGDEKEAQGKRARRGGVSECRGGSSITPAQANRRAYVHLPLYPRYLVQSTKPYKERPRLVERQRTCVFKHSLIVVPPVHPGLPGNSNMSVYSFYIFDRHSELHLADRHNPT